jgi:hypothetical protein
MFTNDAIIFNFKELINVVIVIHLFSNLKSLSDYFNFSPYAKQTHGLFESILFLIFQFLISNSLNPINFLIYMNYFLKPLILNF